MEETKPSPNQLFDLRHCTLKTKGMFAINEEGRPGMVIYNNKNKAGRYLGFDLLTGDPWSSAKPIFVGRFLFKKAAAFLQDWARRAGATNLQWTDGGSYSKQTQEGLSASRQILSQVQDENGPNKKSPSNQTDDGNGTPTPELSSNVPLQ